MDHRKVAERVIKDVGRDNIIAGAHCATRLRLVLKDDSKVDQKALDNDPDVKGTFKTNGQYQVIIGPGDVNDVYDEFIKITGLKELSTDDLKKVAAEGKKKNPVMDFIKLLSDIFVPIIPALVAGGLLMALNNFLTSPGLFGPKSVVQMVPNVAGISAVDFTFTPLLSIMITGFLTFTIIGPVFKGVSDGITNAIVWLYDTTGAFGMGVFGLTYSAIVTTGLHQSFPAVETQLLAAFAKNPASSGDFIFVTACMANVAQGAATFAVYFLTKNKKMKGLASSSGVSALLGITEPALFGVNLKYKFPFFCALIGSGVAAAFAGLMHVTAAALGSAGFLGFLSIYPKTIPMWVVSVLISFAVAFILTYVYGKGHLKEEVAEQDVPVNDVTDYAEETQKAEKLGKEQMALKDEVIASPVDGTPESLTKVNDQVFSAKLMGDGAAVIPSDGTIYSPVTGTVTIAYETKHAYGIKSDDGAEVLIHIGLDTVNLKGEHFESFVKQGQRVNKGDKLGTVDLDAVKKAGYDTTVMVVITNTANYANVSRITDAGDKHGDKLIAVTAHN